MKRILLVFIAVLAIGCAPKVFQAKWLKEKAPENYTTRFETSIGIFDIEIHREWSPKAADRFYQLVTHEYYNNGVFYRVVPEFVAQFGNSDTTVTNRWRQFKVPDEKVKLGNTVGTLSFARSGTESRSTDLYINLGDNSRLDTLNYNNVTGFPAFGKVINGLDVVTQIYSGYEGESAEKLELLFSDRVKYFKEFPKLDTIRKAYIVTQK